MAPSSEVALHAHTELKQAYMLEERLVDDDSELRAGNVV